MNKPRKAPVVLSEEEVAGLLEAAPGLKYKAALSVAYGAGLRVSEVANLKVSDIDSQRMTLRVEQGKGQRDRYVTLSPQLLPSFVFIRMTVLPPSDYSALSQPFWRQSIRGVSGRRCVDSKEYEVFESILLKYGAVKLGNGNGKGKGLVGKEEALMNLLGIVSAAYAAGPDLSK